MEHTHACSNLHQNKTTPRDVSKKKPSRSNPNLLQLQAERDRLQQTKIRFPYKGIFPLQNKRNPYVNKSFASTQNLASLRQNHKSKNNKKLTNYQQTGHINKTEQRTNPKSQKTTIILK